jgi:hypothetical protein
MKTSTRIIDYRLEERIEGQNSRISLSGRSIWAEVWSGANRT